MIINNYSKFIKKLFYSLLFIVFVNTNLLAEKSAENFVILVTENVFSEVESDFDFESDENFRNSQPVYNKTFLQCIKNDNGFSLIIKSCNQVSDFKIINSIEDCGGNAYFPEVKNVGNFLSSFVDENKKNDFKKYKYFDKYYEQVSRVGKVKNELKEFVSKLKLNNENLEKSIKVLEEKTARQTHIANELFLADESGLSSIFPITYKTLSAESINLGKEVNSLKSDKSEQQRFSIINQSNISIRNMLLKNLNLEAKNSLNQLNALLSKKIDENICSQSGYLTKDSFENENGLFELLADMFKVYRGLKEINGINFKITSLRGNTFITNIYTNVTLSFPQNTEKANFLGAREYCAKLNSDSKLGLKWVVPENLQVVNFFLKDPLTKYPGLYNKFDFYKNRFDNITSAFNTPNDAIFIFETYQYFGSADRDAYKYHLNRPEESVIGNVVCYGTTD